VLVFLGWTLRVLGLLLLFSGAALLENLFVEPPADTALLPLGSRLLILFSVPVAGSVLFYCGGRILVRGKQHRAPVITSFGDLAEERYLLYLRPFSLDSEMALPPPDAPGALTRSPFELPGLTNEEFLTRQLSRLGRVVAIGRPGERLPLIGAERGYLPLDDWQDQVSELIRGAHAVLLSAAPGAGTVWEFTEALRTLDPARLVLLIYCGPEDYALFRVAVAREYAVRSSRERAWGPNADWPPLPRLPDLSPPVAGEAKGRRWDTALKGAVVFDHAWRAEFIAFAPHVPRLRPVWTVRRLVRRELEPVLGPLSRLPPARGRAPFRPPPESR
jgi:hypothetical protein